MSATPAVGVSGLCTALAVLRSEGAVAAMPQGRVPAARHRGGSTVAPTEGGIHAVPQP